MFGLFVSDYAPQEPMARSIGMYTPPGSETVVGRMNIWSIKRFLRGAIEKGCTVLAFGDGDDRLAGMLVGRPIMWYDDEEPDATTCFAIRRYLPWLLTKGVMK